MTSMPGPLASEAKQIEMGASEPWPSDADPIVAFVNSKSAGLTEHLDTAQKADMRAYMSLITNVLGNAEAYITWMDPVTLSEVTKPRYGSVYPWPLNTVLTYLKRNETVRRLKAFGWATKSLEEVYKEVENCCQALSERLDSQQYFFNNKPTELDALAFGHLFTILTTPLPDTRLASVVRQYRPSTRSTLTAWHHRRDPPVQTISRNYEQIIRNFTWKREICKLEFDVRV